MNLPSVRSAAPTLLVAAVFVVTVELLRATSPLLDLAAGRIGVVNAAGLAVVIFAAPVLVGLLVAGAGIARALLIGVGLLVGLRLLAQWQSPATLLVVGAGAAAGIAALLLVLRYATAVRSAVAAVTGVLLGTVADLAIRAGYGSWDPIFRPGWGPWLVTVLVAAATLVALLAVRPGLAELAEPVAAGRVGALGPYLALYVMAYGSAPIVAAHAGVSLPVASLVLLGTAGVALELVRRLQLPGGSGALPEPARWFAGSLAMVGLLVGIITGYWSTGPVVLLAVAVAGGSAAVLLARVLTPRPAAVGRPTAAGFAAAGLLAGLGYVVPVMVYQVHFDLQFPFDNRLVLVVFAVLLGLAGLGARPPAAAADRSGLLTRPAAGSLVAVIALLVPLTLVVARPAVPEPTQTGATVRLMSWNLLYGRHHTRGEVDLESVAATIEAVDPDVLLVQELSRGWPIGGGVDMAEWLSRRLNMPYEWSPAADGLFGNALYTRLPVSEVTAQRLPFLQGPMERSYVAASVELAGGEQLHLVNVHLQHRKENTPTRLLQSEALFAAWDGRPQTVIAGDFNFWPSWEEPRRWEAAGFVSAQDVTGHGDEFTGPTDAPDNRVDWIFGTRDLTFTEFRVWTEATNSDHFPLVVTVTLPATPAR